MLRLTPALTLMALPLVLTRLLCFHKRVRPPAGALAPTLEALVLSAFPLAYFFGFLYYTDVPSLLSVVGTIALAAAGKHWAAAAVREFSVIVFSVVLMFMGYVGRACKLYVQADEYHLGVICVRCEPAYASAFPTSGS